MAAPLIYADFNKLDDSNRLKLTCAGTARDLRDHSLSLEEGLCLTFYMDDADDEGRPDDLLVDGIVQRNQVEDCWVAAVDWDTVRHASQERLRFESRVP